MSPAERHEQSEGRRITARRATTGTGARAARTSGPRPPAAPTRLRAPAGSATRGTDGGSAAPRSTAGSPPSCTGRNAPRSAFKSAERASARWTSTLPGIVSRSTSTSAASSSNATTRRTRSASTRVSDPRPAPTSTTVSPASAATASAIDPSMLRSVRKCWPRLFLGGGLRTGERYDAAKGGRKGMPDDAPTHRPRG